MAGFLCAAQPLSKIAKEVSAPKKIRGLACATTIRVRAENSVIGIRVRTSFHIMPRVEARCETSFLCQFHS
jgi:hypothetical protein